MLTKLLYATVQLVDNGDQGNLASKGRVEVLYNGTWGTVCDDDWDLRDANVVCRQLGFPDAVAAKTSTASGGGAGKIWMNSVQCVGNESALTDCDHSGWGINNCDHGQAAGVICNRGGKRHTAVILRGLSIAFNYSNRGGDLNTAGSRGEIEISLTIAGIHFVLSHFINHSIQLKFRLSEFRNIVRKYEHRTDLTPI